MPKTDGSFKKGHKGLKPKGAVNRTTKEAREFFTMVVQGQFDNIESAMKELHDKDKAKYIDSLTKLIQYVLPKKTDITTDDKPIQQLPKIVIKHGT